MRKTRRLVRELLRAVRTEADENRITLGRPQLELLQGCERSAKLGHVRQCHRAVYAHLQNVG